MNDSRKFTRGNFVAGIVVLPALAGLFAAAAAPAQAKATQAAMKYQTKPNGKQQCSNCKLFTAGKTPTANGTCSVVEGDISPKGYCIAYSAK